MRLRTKQLTDFYDHPEDRESAVSHTWVVSTSQAAGLVLLALALAALKSPTWPIGKVYVGAASFSLGALFFVIWAALCWGDRFSRRFRQFKNRGDEIAHLPCARQTQGLSAVLSR